MSVVYVEDQRSSARGKGSEVLSVEDDGGGAGKAKCNAIPASEAAPRNGIVRRSAPSDTSRRIS